MALASLGRLGQRAILGQSWILDTLQGRLGQCGILSSGWTGMDTHWISMALAVDCDPGQSSPFKADWDSVGQCEMDWDNAYPWIFMALASLGRLGQRGILGQSSILDNLQGRLGQCGLGQDWDNGYPLDIHGIGWIPIGYSWHWHPCVDWDSWNPGTILDLRHPSRQDWDNVVQGGLGQSANPWTPIGYPWHWQ